MNNYEVIREAIFTERSTTYSEKENTYTFRVRPDANKIQIKDAIEKSFNVKVENVRTITVHPKKTLDRYRGIVGKKSGYKKALVKLAKGYAIEFV